VDRQSLWLRIEEGARTSEPPPFLGEEIEQYHLRIVNYRASKNSMKIAGIEPIEGGSSGLPHPVNPDTHNPAIAGKSAG